MPGGPAVAVHLAASGTLEVTQRGGVIASASHAHGPMRLRLKRV